MKGMLDFPHTIIYDYEFWTPEEWDAWLEEESQRKIPIIETSPGEVCALNDFNKLNQTYQNRHNVNYRNQAIDHSLARASSE